MATAGMGGFVLCQVSCAQFAGEFTCDVSKQNFSVLASYNWVDRSKPTIYVPGSPPTWVPRPLGLQVAQDSGLVIIDQNSYRNPQYPLEPLFRAVFTQKPDFNPAGIDLVTDRNNLRKLLQFVGGGNCEPFRIGVQRVGGVTLFTRMEDRSSKVLTEFRGFGHEFEKTNTKFPGGLEGSACHHRVVTYDMGGVRCMVRFEVDACIYEDGESPEVVSATADKDVCSSGTFDVVRRGVFVPQSSVSEIKTRAIGRGLNMEDIMPQLWFSGTPLLTAAYHHGGRFKDVQTMKMDAGKLEDWERGNAEGLRKLVRLIRVIIGEVGKVEGGYCVVYGEGGGRLTIRGTVAKNSLPEDLKSRVVDT